MNEHLLVEVVERVLGVECHVDTTQSTETLSVTETVGENGCNVLLSVLNIQVEQFAPFWTSALSVPWGIYENEFAWSCANAKKIQATRAALRIAV